MKAAILEAVEGNNVSKMRRRMKTATYEKLDSVLYKWLKTERPTNIPISCNTFKEKSLEFGKSLGFYDFHDFD